MSKKKYKKQRNYICLDMIERSQNAGPHMDKKKKNNKNICREKVTDDSEQGETSKGHIDVYDMGTNEEDT